VGSVTTVTQVRGGKSSGMETDWEETELVLNIARLGGALRKISCIIMPSSPFARWATIAVVGIRRIHKGSLPLGEGRRGKVAWGS
jgi:hypothetical protein